VAIVLWVYVLNQIDPVGVTAATFPVQAFNVPQGLELLDTQPATVTVRLRGRSSLLRTALRTMSVWVNCQDRPVGESDLQFKIVNRPPTVAVAVTAPDPALVHVLLDLSVSAQRRVTVEPTGLPAEGYQAAAPTADPAEATIRGPAALVQRVARVVAPVNIDGLSTAADRDVHVEARDDNGAVVPRVSIEPDHVHVNLPLRAVNVRVVPVYPTLSDPAAGYRLVKLSVRPSVVIVSGPPALLHQLNAVRTEMFDISSLHGSGRESVPIDPPDGCHVVGTLPAEISITVEPLEKSPAPEVQAAPSTTPPSTPQPKAPTSSEAPTTPAPAPAPAQTQVPPPATPRGGHQ
jgi:YbbR domain-containing protein